MVQLQFKAAQTPGSILSAPPPSQQNLSKIPEIDSVIVGDLAVRGTWVVASLQVNGFWPVKSQKVAYRESAVWILPIMIGYFPSVAMMVPAGKRPDDCARILMRFLSGLSWVERIGISVEGIGGGNLPRPMHVEKTRGFAVCNDFDLSYLPEPTDERALLALALMREGRALNHPGYAFLSFYRVLEVAHPDGRKRGNWVSQRLETLSDYRSKEVIEKLQAQGTTDVGIHLRDSGRRAIAHAQKKPIIDPDNPEDGRRLKSELPL